MENETQKQDGKKNIKVSLAYIKELVENFDYGDVTNEKNYFANGLSLEVFKN